MTGGRGTWVLLSASMVKTFSKHGQEDCELESVVRTPQPGF